MDVAVEAIGGDVTLSGSVHNWSDRELARDAAWGTAGVRSVTDNIALIQ
jgi:osmotically-inducible protein OsmY